ncbi:MAG TPA: hypothetical protein VK191_00920 [Symbiobacteriaceae bacterium]|nr:hypothetical protein [Symbiobacteriaceae bacterium]
MRRRITFGLCALLLAGCAGGAQRPAEPALSPPVESAKAVPPAAGGTGVDTRTAALPDPATRYKGALGDLMAKRYAKAEESLAQLLGEKGTSGRVHLAYALALLGNGKREAALAACQQAADRKAPGAEACLTDLRADLPALPAGEENLGAYKWDGPRGYRWTGPARSGQAEFVRVSPPTVCAYKQVDGFWVFNYTCGGDGRVFQWSFDAPFAGKSPSGIGLGTSLVDLEARWGKGLQQPEGLCWYASTLRLCAQPSDDQQSVRRILVNRRGLPHLVPALYYLGAPL